MLTIVLLCTASFVCGTAAGAAEAERYLGNSISNCRISDNTASNSANGIDLCASAALTSQGTTQLTASSADDLYPSWSPDGSKILFSSNMSGNYDVWVMDSDGSNKVQLTTDSAGEKYPVWNHAGNKIVFTRYNDSASHGWGGYQLWIMNSDGTNQQMLNINESWYDQDSPTWSPDDSNIAFVSFGPSGYEKIYVYDISTCSVTNITPVDQEINPGGISHGCHGVQPTESHTTDIQQVFKQSAHTAAIISE